MASVVSGLHAWFGFGAAIILSLMASEARVQACPVGTHPALDDLDTRIGKIPLTTKPTLRLTNGCGEV